MSVIVLCDETVLFSDECCVRDNVTLSLAMGLGFGVQGGKASFQGVLHMSQLDVGH